MTPLFHFTNSMYKSDNIYLPSLKVFFLNFGILLNSFCLSFKASQR